MTDQFDAEGGPSRKLYPLQVTAPEIEAWVVSKNPVASGAWNEIGAAEHARSFTAARTAGTDIADDLYFGLVDTLSRGGTEKDFTDLVTPILRKKGWLDGDEGQIARRVELIYDTNLRVARSAGRWAAFQRTKSAFPYIRAFTVGDERVRHPPKSKASDHRAWDGIILPIDHSFWTRWFPPLGFRCRCGVMQMTRGQLARYKTGITSDAELAEREARLGDPIFLSPVAPIGAQLKDMVKATNEGRMPGMPPIDPRIEEEKGRAAWTEEENRKAFDDVERAIRRLFGDTDMPVRRPITINTPIEPPAPPKPVPVPDPVPVAPPPPPPPVARGFRSPVNPDVNAETIKVEPRVAVQKRLTKDLAETAKDPRYDPKREFADRLDKDFGKASFSTGFNDETVSAIAAIKPELDALSDMAGIPRIRGFKTISGNAAANQGDGVMGINPSWFNAWSSDVGGRVGGVLGEIEKKRDAIAAELGPIRAKIQATRDRLDAISRLHSGIPTLIDRPGFREAWEEQGELLKLAKKLRAKDEALWKQASAARRTEAKPLATWRPGDDVKARPYGATDYYGGLDKARAVLFHEFGHHIHQYANKAGRRSVVGRPPVERELMELFRTAKRDQQLSTYATTNEHEWFAENFAAYAMGRPELVDPTVIQLIERLFRG